MSNLTPLLTPLKLSATLSILLHGVVVVFLLSTIQSTIESKRPGGESLSIELVASVTPGSQSQAMQGSQSKQASSKKSEKSFSEEVIYQTKQGSDIVIAKAPAENVTSKKPISEQSVVENVSHDNAEDSITLSSNALQQPESMLGLLHASISANKEYPYLARRQRREGMATVGFILHPDGTIADTHLVHSSNTNVLDRAALSAVKRIEPFKPAMQYLERAETFKVDVVFSLL